MKLRDRKRFIADNKLSEHDQIIDGLIKSKRINAYSDAAAFILDIKMRKGTIQGIQGIETKREQMNLMAAGPKKNAAYDALCCAYGDSNAPDPLKISEGRALYSADSAFWEPTDPFTEPDPLRYPKEFEDWKKDGALYKGKTGIASYKSAPGVSGSAAIEGFLKPGLKDKNKNQIDCNGMLTTVQYKALLDLYGPVVFDTLFASQGLQIFGFSRTVAITTRNKAIQLEEHELLKQGIYVKEYIPIKDEKEKDLTKYLVPGDRVYFANHPDFLDCDATSAWRGEHALYVGGGKFAGFGLASAATYEQMLASLWRLAAQACTDHPTVLEALNKKGPAGLEGIRGKNAKGRPVIKIYRLDPERLRQFVFEKIHPLLRAR